MSKPSLRNALCLFILSSMLIGLAVILCRNHFSTQFSTWIDAAYIAYLMSFFLMFCETIRGQGAVDRYDVNTHVYHERAPETPDDCRAADSDDDDDDDYDASSLTSVIHTLPDTIRAIIPSPRHDDSDRRPRCVVCLDAVPNALFLPCGHLCTCTTCARTTCAASTACPMCRQPVLRTLPVYSM